jgi:hypothetical protein
MLALKKKHGDPMTGALFLIQGCRSAKMFLSFCKVNSISVSNPCGIDTKKLVDIGRWLDFNEV